MKGRRAWHWLQYRVLQNGKRIFSVLMLLFLMTVSFVFLYPFLYMLVTSIKSYADLNDVSINWIPRTPTLRNYAQAWEILEYPRHFMISLGLTATCIAAKIFVSSFIAYGFARYRFVGRGPLFAMVILTMIVPTQTILLPQYIQFSHMGWVKTALPILIPQLFGLGLRGGIFIFLFRQFFLGIPKSLEEAARLDGCGPVGTYLRISLPAAQSAIIITIVLAMVWCWNDYYEAQIYLKDMSSWPLPKMLQQVYYYYEAYRNPSGISASNYNLASQIRTMDAATLEKKIVSEGTLMAATFLVILPVLIAYAFLQRRFIQGIERSGLVD